MADQEKKTKSVQINVYSTQEEREFWRESAAKEGRSLSGLIQYLLREYFGKKGASNTLPQRPTRAPKVKE